MAHVLANLTRWKGPDIFPTALKMINEGIAFLRSRMKALTFKM